MTLLHYLSMSSFNSTKGLVHLLQTYLPRYNVTDISVSMVPITSEDNQYPYILIKGHRPEGTLNFESKNKSNATDVQQFTSETGSSCPDQPELMTRDSVLFIIRMIISELDELACTVSHNEQERDDLIKQAVETRDKCTKFVTPDVDKHELIGDQFDALVDSWYYSLNVAAKHGVNMSRIFDIVHKANMDKRDPATGKFLRRETDGKIIKPEGWCPPDITNEIKRQHTEGSWV